MSVFLNQQPNVSRTAGWRPVHSQACALLLAGLVGQAASAQCSPVDCTGITGWPSTSTTPTIDVDRRPVAVINLFGGQWDVPTPNASTSGIRPEWRTSPGGVTFLLDQLDCYYDRGWRRIVIMLPAGALEGEVYPMAQYWTMLGWQQDAFENDVVDWLKEHPGVKLGLYLGIAIDDDPCSLDTSSWHAPAPSSNADACVVYANIQPWIDVGFTEFWFDYAALNSTTTSRYISMSQSSIFSGVYLGGEAFPLSSTPGYVDSTLIYQSRWQSKRTLIQSQAGNSFTAWLTTPLSTVDTEMHVAYTCDDLESDPQDALQDVKDDRTRGLIPWSMDGTRTDELITRCFWPQQWPSGFSVSNLGLACPADLDVDGTVGSSDLAQLMGAWGATGVSLAEGDLTGDGAVGSGDLAFLMGSWGCNSGGLEDCFVEYCP